MLFWRVYSVLLVISPSVSFSFFTVHHASARFFAQLLTTCDIAILPHLTNLDTMNQHCLLSPKYFIFYQDSALEGSRISALFLSFL